MATDTSLPGPRIDLVPEMVRWWDRWLRGEGNGVDEAPPVTVFVRHSTRPAPDPTSSPGGGGDEPVPPPAGPAAAPYRWTGADGAPVASAPPDQAPTHPPARPWDRLDVRPDVGSAAWISCAGHPLFRQPRPAGRRRFSLVYDWELDEELEVLGCPRLVARVGASAPVAFLSAVAGRGVPGRDSTWPPAASST